MAKAQTASKTKFAKAQVLKSDKYGAFKDVLSVVLEDGKEYTEEEIEKLKNDFLSRPINEEVNQ